MSRANSVCTFTLENLHFDNFMCIYVREKKIRNIPSILYADAVDALTLIQELSVDSEQVVQYRSFLDRITETKFPDKIATKIGKFEFSSGLDNALKKCIWVGILNKEFDNFMCIHADDKTLRNINMSYEDANEALNLIDNLIDNQV